MAWSYIAGFFDGEGSLVHNKKGFRIFITQTNQEVLEKIKTFTNFGYVIKISKRKPHWKDSWLYFIAKQEDIYQFLISTSSLLIVKKELILKAIPQLKDALFKQQQRKKKFYRRIKMSKKLREKGYSYRKIGKILKIDFGYARRLSLK